MGIVAGDIAGCWCLLTTLWNVKEINKKLTMILSKLSSSFFIGPVRLQIRVLQDRFHIGGHILAFVRHKSSLGTHWKLPLSEWILFRIYVCSDDFLCRCRFDDWLKVRHWTSWIEFFPPTRSKKLMTTIFSFSCAQFSHLHEALPGVFALLPDHMFVPQPWLPTELVWPNRKGRNKASGNWLFTGGELPFDKCFPLIHKAVGWVKW